MADGRVVCVAIVIVDGGGSGVFYVPTKVAVLLRFRPSKPSTLVQAKPSGSAAFLTIAMQILAEPRVTAKHRAFGPAPRNRGLVRSAPVGPKVAMNVSGGLLVWHGIQGTSFRQFPRLSERIQPPNICHRSRPRRSARCWPAAAKFLAAPLPRNDGKPAAVTARTRARLCPPNSRPLDFGLERLPALERPIDYSHPRLRCCC